MEKMSFLLLDVGGTFVKSVVATVDGVLLPETEASVPIDSDGTRAEIEESFAKVIAKGNALSNEAGYTLAGVGIAFPGPFDYKAGISYMKHKFAALEGLPLTDFFQSLPEVGKSRPVVFMHDVTAAVKGEMEFGAGRGFKNIAVVTLGTGLGFAHTKDGEIQYDKMGEPSLSLYNRPYRDGELEDYASKRGFMRAYAEVRGCENPGGLTVAMIGGMATNGGNEALQAFHNVGEILAEQLKPILQQNGIECLLFGGQISRSFAHLESALRPLFDEVPTLKHLSPMQNLSTAAPLGLLSLLREKMGL